MIKYLSILLCLAGLVSAEDKMTSEENLIKESAVFCVFKIDSMIDTIHAAKWQQETYLERASVEQIITGKVDSIFTIRAGLLVGSYFGVGKRYIAYLIKTPKGYYTPPREKNLCAKQIIENNSVRWYKDMKSTWNIKKPPVLEVMPVDSVAARVQKYLSAATQNTAK